MTSSYWLESYCCPCTNYSSVVLIIMDKNQQEEAKFVVVDANTNQKVSKPMTESQAKKVVDKAKKESAAPLATRQILHG